MKKTGLYLLIYLGVTVIAILLSILLPWLLTNAFFQSLGIDRSEAVIWSISASCVIWCAIIIGIFVGKGYSTISWGSLQGRQRWLLTLWATLFCAGINTIAFWCQPDDISFSTTHALELQSSLNSPILAFVIASTMYVSTHVVGYGAILRQLLNTWQSPWKAIATVTVLLFLIDIYPTPPFWTLLLASAVINVLVGLIFCATRSILPGLLACITTDYLLWVGLHYNPGTVALVCAVVATVVSLPPLVASLRREWS